MRVRINPIEIDDRLYESAEVWFHMGFEVYKAYFKVRLKTGQWGTGIRSTNGIPGLVFDAVADAALVELDERIERDKKNREQLSLLIGRRTAARLSEASAQT